MGENQLRPLEKEPSSVAKRSAPIVRSGRVRRAGSRRQGLIALFVVLVIGGLLAAGYFLFLPGDETFVLTDYTTAVAAVETLQDTVELSGVVAARANATVTAPETGFLEVLFVEEGDWVNPDQLVAILRAEELEDKRTDLRRTLEREQRDYAQFRLQHEYAMRAYARDRDKILEQLEDARDDLADERELFQIGSGTRAAIENAEEAIADLEDALEDHDASVEEAVALHELSLQNFEDDIASIQEEMADIDERLAQTRIMAPISGRVVSISDEAMTAGELLTQYGTILEISDTSDPVIQSEIEEQYVPLIEIGQPVAIEVSGTRAVGAIERIGQIASASSDGGTPTVEIDVAVPEVGELLPGTSALLEVLVGEVADAIVLPRGAYLTSGNRRYVYVIEGETARRVEVEYGTTTDTRVQVTAGVSPGDRVITSSYQTFVDRSQIQTGGTR